MNFYRFLLKLYPARFREEFAGPLERQFRDEYREARTGAARVGFWLSALADLAFSIPALTLREVAHDLRHGARAWRRRPLLTMLALAALALGIGARTGVFSVLNALLLRSLPFREPERLVEIQSPPVNPFHGRARFQKWRDDGPYAQELGAWSPSDMNLTVDDRACGSRWAPCRDRYAACSCDRACSR